MLREAYMNYIWVGKFLKYLGAHNKCINDFIENISIYDDCAVITFVRCDLFVKNIKINNIHEIIIGKTMISIMNHKNTCLCEISKETILEE